MKVIAALAALLLASAATALEDDPAHFRNRDITFVSHVSHAPKHVKGGFHRLDKAKVISCRSAEGCIIMFGATVSVPNVSFEICGVIDGSNSTPEPSCSRMLQSTSGSSRQRAFVSQGPHTVQTEVRLFTDGNISAWETDYTIYEKGDQEL